MGRKWELWQWGVWGLPEDRMISEGFAVRLYLAMELAEAAQDYDQDDLAIVSR